MNGSFRIAAHIISLELVLTSLIVAIAVAAVAINVRLARSLRNAQFASIQIKSGA